MLCLNQLDISVTLTLLGPLCCCFITYLLQTAVPEMQTKTSTYLAFSLSARVQLEKNHLNTNPKIF